MYYFPIFYDKHKTQFNIDARIEFDDRIAYHFYLISKTTLRESISES